MQRKFILVIDGESGPDLVLDDQATSQSTALCAALSSNPTIVEVSPDLQIGIGWSWDGSNFTAPQE
jgi:hypothetical protein